MTIYSTHPSRGKTQILTTFIAADGVQSCTVTSVEDKTSATAITDALNRISACATVPVSVYDRRGDQHEHYPQDHLSAITDPAWRSKLRTGAHSLWYEYVSMHLHRALSDLDDALARVPGPVATAVGAELATEVAALRAALTEYHEGIEPDDAQPQRSWDFAYPTVLPFAEPDLSPETREHIDRLEDSLHTPDLVNDAITDLRLLFDAHNQSADDSIDFEADALALFYEPDPGTPGGFYLSLDAPRPDFGRSTWDVTIARWIPEGDLDDDGEPTGARGEAVTTCSLTARPSLHDLVVLLDLAAAQQDQLANWATTPIGIPLHGTSFIVTEHNPHLLTSTA